MKMSELNPTFRSLALFPRSARLKKRFEFLKVMQAGKKFQGAFLIIFYCEGSGERPRLGLTVARAYGKAHKRNRFKRCVREAFRRLQNVLPPNIELNITPKYNASLICFLF